MTWEAGAAPTVRQALLTELTTLLDVVIMAALHEWAEEMDQELLDGDGWEPGKEYRGIFGA